MTGASNTPNTPNTPSTTAQSQAVEKKSLFDDKNVKMYGGAGVFALVAIAFGVWKWKGKGAYCKCVMLFLAKLPATATQAKQLFFPFLALSSHKKRDEKL